MACFALADESMTMCRYLIFLAAQLTVLVAANAHAQSQALPDGPRKDLVVQHCSGACHEMQRIEEAQGSHTEWVVRIRRMIRRGAVIPPERIGPLADYLAEALPLRVRAQAASTSLITTTVGEVLVRPIQTWVRAAGALQSDEQTIIAVLSQSDAVHVKVGQRVRAFALGSRSSMHQGRVSRVIVGANSTQVHVRLVTSARRDNYLLEIIAEHAAVLSIPNEAIIEEGERQVVYLQRKSGDFEPRAITTGVQGELYTHVTGGLIPGERVVTFGSFFIDAEYKMKSASMPPANVTDSIVIGYRGNPDPPIEGDNEVRVTVTQPSGAPVVNADVNLTFYMPAMPSMNMPEMRNDFRLTHLGAGVYGCTARFSMTGTWIVTVTVSQGGAAIGKKELTLIVK